jgi:hypothetical protein
MLHLSLFCTIPMPCKRMFLSAKMTSFGNGEVLTGFDVVLFSKNIVIMYDNYGCYIVLMVAI